MATRVPWRSDHVEIIGHRGARGLVVESTLAGFLHAVGQGATALELDVQLTADGQVVVWHDPVLLPGKATDTGPAATGDPRFPYVGSRLRELTYGQLACVDIGRRTLALHPGQRSRPASRIPLLAEVLQVVHELDPSVWFLVELKTDPTRPGLTSPPDAMVPAVLDVVDHAGASQRVVLQSFDWRVVELAAERAPHVARAALAITGRTFAPGSPWLGRLRFQDHRGLPAAAAALGAHAVSPAYASPHGASSAAAGFALVPDRDFVTRAHDLGLAVLPWTVNTEADMAAVLAAGADGLITDYPDRAVRVRRRLGA